MPGLQPFLVHLSSPQIDYRLTANLDTQRRAALLWIIEYPGKGIAQCLKTHIKKTLYLHHCHSC